MRHPIVQAIARVMIPTVAVFGVAAAIVPIQVVRHAQQAQEFQAAHAAQQAERARERAEMIADQQLAALKAERDAALQASADKDAQLQEKDQRIHDLEQQVAFKAYTLGARGGTATSPSAALAPGNRFVWGNCTWYVFNLRPIPWLGNAIEWWANAAAYGYAEGYTPKVGAIMVSRDSWFGHVAYVSSIVGDGTWWVREMNFTCGVGCADVRLVRPGGTLVGFIY